MKLTKPTINQEKKLTSCVLNLVYSDDIFCVLSQVFEPDTLSIGSVDNPGVVHEEEEDMPPPEGSCPDKDTTEEIRNKINNGENADLPQTRSKENSLEEEVESEEGMYTKEKLRQESKESDTAEVTSPVSTL